MPRVKNPDQVRKLYISFAVPAPQRSQSRNMARFDGLNMNELDRMVWTLGLSRLCEASNKRLVAVSLFKKQGIDLDDLPESVAEDIPFESVDVEAKETIRFPVPERLNNHASALSVADGVVRAELDRQAWCLGLAVYAELMNKRLVNASLLGKSLDEQTED